MSRSTLTGTLELLACMAIACTTSKGLAAQPLSYQDTCLSAEERARDLAGRLTLEQIVSQLLFNSPAIPEFGIHQYNWWNEAIHGAARAGLATVFPQSIAIQVTIK